MCLPSTYTSMHSKEIYISIYDGLDEDTWWCNRMKEGVLLPFVVAIVDVVVVELNCEKIMIGPFWSPGKFLFII